MKTTFSLYIYIVYILFFSHSLHPYLCSLPQTKSQRLLLSLSLSLSQQAQRHRDSQSWSEPPRMDDDWGLQAVVRGCSSAVASTGAAAASTNTTTTTSFMAHNDFFQPNNNNNNSFFFSPFGSSNNNSGQHQSSGQLFSLTDPLRARNHAAMEELHELYKPFFPKSQTSSSPNIISISSLNSSSSSDQRSGVVQTKQQPQNIVNPSTKQSHGASTIPRSKKRKNQLKKVCQVPAESLSSDIWAWRKYGQKPIKGSPYPRGYYRCSSSKGCLARKQVERNKSDPGMFIVTYTAEHNHPAPTHRNSLAGSTRQKPSSSAVSAVGDAGKYPSAGKSSSPATSVEEELTAAQAQSTTTESKEGQESSSLMMDDEEEDEFGFSDVAVSDDFFVGLEGLGSPATGDFFSDYFPSSFGLPWVASNAATAAGGS